MVSGFRVLVSGIRLRVYKCKLGGRVSVLMRFRVEGLHGLDVQFMVTLIRLEC